MTTNNVTSKDEYSNIQAWRDLYGADSDEYSSIQAWREWNADELASEEEWICTCYYLIAKAEFYEGYEGPEHYLYGDEICQHFLEEIADLANEIADKEGIALTVQIDHLFVLGRIDPGGRYLFTPEDEDEEDDDDEYEEDDEDD